MLFVVVPVSMVFIVVLFMLMYRLLLAMPSGVLVPPYHLTYDIIFIKVVVHIILSVVVAVFMVLFVVSLILMNHILLLLPTGALALPYHLNPSLFIVIILLKIVVVITFVVVVPAVMGSIVVSLILASVLNFLGHTGTLALPYHLNKATSTAYAYRGGASNNGLLCGVFSVGLNYYSGNTGWGFSAALSFK